MSAHVKTLEDEDKNKYNKLLSFYLNYELLKNIKAFGLKLKTCIKELKNYIEVNFLPVYNQIPDI